MLAARQSEVRRGVSSFFSSFFSALFFSLVPATENATLSLSSSFVPPANVYSEDCLFLNVYTPANHTSSSPPLPVLFWIHGGAFVFGGGGAITYDGIPVVQNRPNTIVVTINYRLGTLGYLALSALSDEAGNGAWLFQDQQLALHWVQDNIGAFGGDPNRVTIWGESAGCASVTFHLTTESSWPLFNQSICESSPSYQQSRHISGQISAGQVLAFQKCGFRPALPCLRALPPSDFGFPKWLPAVGCGGSGSVIPLCPYNAIQELSPPVLHPGPLLIGSNSNEGRLFVYGVFAADPVPPAAYSFFARTILVLIVGVPFDSPLLSRILDRYPCPSSMTDCRPVLSRMTGSWLIDCPTQETLAAKSFNDPDTTFAYEFNHTPSWENPELLATHATELAFVFNTVRFYSNETDELELGKSMSGSWADFGRTGQPSVPPAGSAWPPYEPSNRMRPEIVTGTEWPLINSRFENECAFWAPIFRSVYGGLSSGSCTSDTDGSCNATCTADYSSCDPQINRPCCDSGFVCKRHTVGSCNASITENYLCVPFERIDISNQLGNLLRQL
jgi:para-nitrobenzyl esterase